MNVNLTKLISSAAAVLAVGSSSYAQQKASMPTQSSCCFEQGYEICNDKFPAAYNAAARIDVQCSWDLFATASFIYWHVDQDAMDLAYPLVTGEASGNVLVQKFNYKPGFKVGLGVNFDHDNWVGFVEYTWFHQTTNTGMATAPAGTTWLPTAWFNADNEIGLVSAIGSKWRTNLDIVDATLSRPYYQGRKLTILPFGGLRGAWIRQNLKVEATTSTATVLPVLANNQSHNWAVGPRAGLQAHWMLGCGFRIEGDVAGSLLYTRFTRVTHWENAGDGTQFETLSFKGYNTVRPMADMGLGIGWGSYFDRQNYHFDLLANYDFNVMWGQNMMREVANLANSLGASSEAADLHLQGLTVTARFDF